MNKKILFSIIGVLVVVLGIYFFLSLNTNPPVNDKSSGQNVETGTLNTNSTQTKNEPSGKTTTTNTNTPKTTPTPTPSVTTGYTVADVSLHSSENSCWSIVNNNVYDLTSYISLHPGGAKNILRICGINGTALFEGQHGGNSRPEKILEGYYLGVLK